MSAALFVGQRIQMSRKQAVERYILLRLRFEDIRRLSFLVEGFYHQAIGLPPTSPFTHRDFKDTLRTTFFGWFATLTDRDEKVVYAFDPLLALFPDKRSGIIKVQLECEGCHSALQQFRNNVAFHNRASLRAHFKARQAIREDDMFLSLESARQGLFRLMDDLVAAELTCIPELPNSLADLGVSHHPAFTNLFPKQQTV